MNLRSSCKAYENGHGHDEGTSSKQRRSSEEGEVDASKTGGSRLRKVYEGQHLAEMDTSSGSDYMPKRSEGGGSDSGSE